MVENLEGISEIAINENLQPNEEAILESIQLETFEEKSFISEVDEIRAVETAEIMAEVFPKEVLANWTEMSLDEKTAKINEYYIKAGENLGIETKGVIVEPMSDEPGSISYGYNSGDGYIHLNEAVVDDPAQLQQVLDTATHEMRHQFQSDVLADPQSFADIPQDVLDAWEYEMDPGNYISPDYDYQGYYEQAIECDARDYSESVLDFFVQNLGLN